MSNCSIHDITIGIRDDKMTTLKDIKRNFKNNGEVFIEESVPVLQNKLQQTYVIESGKIFYVPLSWFLEEKAIYIEKGDRNFHLLFPNIREYFNPSLDIYDHIEANNIEVESDKDSS